MAIFVQNYSKRRSKTGFCWELPENYVDMTKEDRQNAILEQLLVQESVLVSDLATSLDVSLVTIRKDLTELVGQENCTGATARPSSSTRSPTTGR